MLDVFVLSDVVKRFKNFVAAEFFEGVDQTRLKLAP